MRKIDPQRLFNGLITWINWMPKLILLHFVVGLLIAFFYSGNSDKKYDCGD